MSWVKKNRKINNRGGGGVVADKNDLVKYNYISNEVFSFSKSLFERTDQTDNLDHNTLLQSITLPSVKNDQKFVCDNNLTIKNYLML